MNSVELFQQLTVWLPTCRVEAYLEKLGNAQIYVRGYYQLIKGPLTLLKVLPSNPEIVQTPEIVEKTLQITQQFTDKIKCDEVVAIFKNWRLLSKILRRFGKSIINSYYDDLDYIILQSKQARYIYTQFCQERISKLPTADVPLMDGFETILLDQFTVCLKQRKDFKVLVKKLNKLGINIRAYLFHHKTFKFVPSCSYYHSDTYARYMTKDLLDCLGFVYTIQQVVAIRYQPLPGQLAKAALLLQDKVITTAVYYDAGFEAATWGIYETNNVITAQKALSGK